LIVGRAQPISDEGVPFIKGDGGQVRFADFQEYFPNVKAAKFRDAFLQKSGGVSGAPPFRIDRKI
jgi:hypothetical protein